MPDTSPKPETISNGTNWVMIIDDEFDIVSTFKQGLERRGFHVFGFTEPTLALEHFQLNQEKYGLVISDLRMPGMGVRDKTRNQGILDDSF